MIKTDLLNILQKLGIQALDINDNWIKVSCPLADVNHTSKSDKNPSAGFSINDKGNSAFHCFACGSRSMESILHSFKWKKGVDLLEEYLSQEVSETTPDISYKEKVFIRKESVPVPEHILNHFEPIDAALPYLTKRGISLEVAKKYGLKYCNRFITSEGRTWRNAVLTPIRDLDFKTYWLHFRSIDSKVFWHGKPEHFNCDVSWGRDDSFFGMEWLDLLKPVILVEGAFDVMRLNSLGVTNVIATHGGVSSKSEKLKRLIALNPVSIVSGFDADKAGQSFRHAVECLVHKNIEVLDWGVVGCKDAGDLKSRQDLDIVLKQRNINFQDKWRVKL